MKLQVQNNRIFCVGLEKNKRKLLSSILYEESKVNFVNLDFLQNSFTDIDIIYIKDSTQEILTKYHYFINDYSLINLILHIAIAIDRIKNNNTTLTPISLIFNEETEEFKSATELTLKLENKFNIQFNKNEIYEISLLLISRTTSFDYKTINKNNIETIIGAECLNLVKTLIEEIRLLYYISLEEDEFFIRFALHIKNLLIRSKNNYFSKNPLADEIKLSCPLIYDVSVGLANKIQEKTGIRINDDEIAYIAFHIGSTLKSQRHIGNKLKTILYCPNYYDLSYRIIDNINNNFCEYIVINDVITDESKIDLLDDVDLIISTISICKNTTIPICKISIIVNESDKSVIMNKIKVIQKEKKIQTFKNYLNQIMSPDLFMFNDKTISEDECISLMCNTLCNFNYVDDSFINEILEREKISSTAFYNFAIPHSMKMTANKTGICILISHNPIKWNNNNVNLVMMLCFNANQRHIFNEIFEPLTMILSESVNLNALTHVTGYDEFINTIVGIYAKAN